ncbi:DNA-directed RNA polymerase subunit alpha [Candidatus Parcubacteria bacterium]|jgi:DNA-directed RNA polymerase subunit alpha|nr:DNA-directed RNA polymerase subunit alpha [Candidatus Parcubacteria bacterium]MBT7228821.1 DNA-directed RNA polymerase subunit alpha [Candidatus Parcubacteria bacterium]
MTQITLPDKVSIKDLKDNRYKVVMEPFYPGYGVTVGNSLRRTMLSSLSGGAVTSFKIEGAQHEFDSIDFLKEDLVEIMLNLKRLRLKVHTDEPVKLTLSVKGQKVVTAADIDKNSDVEVINTDLEIANLTDKSAKFEMEITAERGLGYFTVEQRTDRDKLEIGHIAIDASFSPILNVGFDIENVRVGEMTNYEKLTIEILTDGTIDAKTAIGQASDILQKHFNFLGSDDKEEEVKEVVEEEKEDKKEQEEKEDKKEKKTKSKK